MAAANPDSGNGKYSKEERAASMRRNYAAAAQKLVGSGEAATMEQARTLLGRRCAEAVGEVALMEGERMAAR